LLGNYTLIDSANSIFSKYLNNGRGRKKILVRPQAFKVHLKKKHGVAGRVATVKYFGTHDEVTVNCGGESIYISTVPFLLKPGKKVHVSLKP
jgi:hypothetical protein